MRKKIVYSAVLGLLLFSLAGCGSQSAAGATDSTEIAARKGEPGPASEDAYVDNVEVGCDQEEIEDEAVALADSAPAVPTFLTSSAPGTLEKREGDAVIDYSNTDDGYVMVQYATPSEKRLKALVTGPTTQYQYNLTPGKWATLPLSDGNGGYQVGLYMNVEGTSYATVLSESMDVTMEDEFAPFLRPNQYVDYEDAPKTVAKAKKLCGKEKDTLKKVEIVYDFVVNGMTYDKEQAATVQSGYLPILDKVLKRKKGICFDYAALMTGMLRSQGVPCKLVVGYAGEAYHAWISVWTDEEGWVDGAVYFDGTSWQRMDPTFVSSAHESESVMQYIGDGSNYTSKYFY